MLHFERSILLCTVILFALSACGGGGDSSSSSSSTNNSSASQGVFIDSAVEGLRFETATQSGFTDANGTFLFQTGELVSFYIGDILIGNAGGQAQITPIDLVPGATDATNSQVTNILRFVQSLDQDNNPDNGIVISGMVSTMASGQSLDFTLSIANFEATANAVVSFITSGAVTSLISANDAIAHFQASIGVGGAFGSLAFSGADSGAVGTPFQPSLATAIIGPIVGSVSWGEGPGRALTVAIVNGNISTIFFGTPASLTEIYAYFLSCDLTPADCTGISLDLPGQSLTLTDVDLPVGVGGGGTNLATSPLTANGTITWN